MSKLKFGLWLVFLSGLAAGVFVAPSAPVGAAPPNPPSNVIVGKPVTPVSFDGDLRQLPRLATTDTVPLLRRPAAVPTPSASKRAPLTNTALARQTKIGAGRMPSPSVNFDGLDSMINASRLFPPDPNGDVGPNHYIQTVNVGIGIFSKTGTLLASFTYNSFFATALAPCNTGNHGDVIVLYDAQSDRWFITDFAWTIGTGPYFECIAVSKTADPLSGGWWFYTVDIGSTTTPGVYWFPDYPKLGVWWDAIYMSANMFAGSTVVSARAYAFNRADLISGGVLRNVAIDVLGAYALLPSNLRGAAPPAGAPNYYAAVNPAGALSLWEFSVPDWNNTSTATLTGPTNVPIASFAIPCVDPILGVLATCVPQLGGSSVDALGDLLMMQLQYRNRSGVESLWVNHTVAASSDVGYPTGIRWYEVRDPGGTPTIYQQGTYQPDTNYRWTGSLAVDRDGNAALGFNVSSAAMYPAIRYTGRLLNDPLGTMGQGEVEIIAGGGSQIGSNRWGDYSAMTIDPTDDCTFWYTGEYYSTSGNVWRTRVAAFKVYPWCGSTPPVVSEIYYFPWVSKAASQ